MKAFGSRDLIRCVECLGFKFNRQSSHHLIYEPPKNRQNPEHRPYSIQIGKKSYIPHSRSRYISELKSYGFTKDQIEKCL